MESPEFPKTEITKLQALAVGDFGLFRNSVAYRGTDKGRVLLFFNGAVNQSIELKPMHFQRWSWATAIDEPALFISDPSVGSTTRLRLGWYVGTRTEPGFEDFLAPYVDVARKAYPKARLIAVGSSGGGFASLKAIQKRLVDGAIVFNPQTDVLRYGQKPMVSQFLRYFGAKAEELTEADRARLSVLDIGEFGTDQIVHYYQNKLDEDHYQNHFMPYVDAVSKMSAPRSTQVNFHIYSDNKGHNPPDRPSTLAVLKRALDSV